MSNEYKSLNYILTVIEKIYIYIYKNYTYNHQSQYTNIIIIPVKIIKLKNTKQSKEINFIFIA